MAEWLQQNFFPVIEGTWATSPERDIDQAFVQADETLLQPKVSRFCVPATVLCHCASVSAADTNRACLPEGWLLWGIWGAWCRRLEVWRHMCTCTGDQGTQNILAKQQLEHGSSCLAWLCRHSMSLYHSSTCTSAIEAAADMIRPCHA